MVDDEDGLPELYTILLERTGYLVRGFHHRTKALAALAAEKRKPALLITDYCGLTMPVDCFLKQCLVVHPALRILMASGFSQADVRFSQAKPDRFIRKPFTAEELRQEVRAILAA